MNTTNTEPSSIQTHGVLAHQMTVGTLYRHSDGLKFVTAVEASEESYVTIRWDGGCTMCEPDAVLCVAGATH